MAPSAAASPDLSWEGPFDASQSALVSGVAPLVLDNLPGCQYRMTSYDNADMTNVDLTHTSWNTSGRPSRTPGYWLHHMDQEEAVSAAVQLQHDTGLIITNLQVLC